MSEVLEGTIYKIEELNQVSDKFKKQEVILEIENERNPEWNDFVKIEFQQAKCDLVNDLSKDDKVAISYNIKGRIWKDKETGEEKGFFNTITGWRVEKLEGVAMPEFNAADMPPAPDETDLPF